MNDLYETMKNSTKPCKVCGGTEGYMPPESVTVSRFYGIGVPPLLVQVLATTCKRCSAIHEQEYFMPKEPKPQSKKRWWQIWL